tara:strand:+ start:1077 stop:1313 length:237 start_codon:yes stop_codon:yes gene_type:complete
MKVVQIKVGKESIEGLLNKNELIIGNVIEVGDTINIDGKDKKVDSFTKHPQSDALIINIAKASKSTKEIKSDDKQTKG